MALLLAGYRHELAQIEIFQLRSSSFFLLLKQINSFCIVNKLGTEKSTSFILFSQSSFPTWVCEDIQQHEESRACSNALMPGRNSRGKRWWLKKSICEEKQVNQAMGIEQELKIPTLSGEILSCFLTFPGSSCPSPGIKTCDKSQSSFANGQERKVITAP